MKRIVQVVHNFLPRNPFGTENYTYHLSKELQKTNEVYIFCRENKDSLGKDFSQDEVFHGLPVRRLYFNPSWIFDASYRNSFVDKEFESFLDEIRPDIVHFQHLMGLSASMIQVARQRGIPAVLTLHDFWFICSQVQLLTNGNRVCSGPDSNDKCANCETIPFTYNYIYRESRSFRDFYDRILRFLKYPPGPLKSVKKLVPGRVRAFLKQKFLKAQPPLPSLTPSMKAKMKGDMIAKRFNFLRQMLDKVDIILSPSKFLKEKFIHYGMGENRIFHLQHGIKHTPLINLSKEPSNKFRFGFIGNVSEHKGIKVLIKAFNRIKKDDVVLSIFGPYDKYYLSKLRKELNIGSRVTFYGPFDNRQISSVFSKIDVLVFPSIWYENQPITLLEVLLAKIPIITSNLGGMAELVQDGVTGLLFEVGNSEDLCQKMVSLMDNRELLKRLSETPRQVKSIEKNAQELNEIYDSLLGKAWLPKDISSPLRGEDKGEGEISTL